MFHPISPESDTSNAIIGQIIENVRCGNLSPGDPLPTERSLAESFGVSRPAVREALNAMRIMKLVRTVHGGHNYITDDFRKGLIVPLSILFNVSKTDIREIEQLRAALECRSAYLAAKVINERQLKSLKAILDKWNKTTTRSKKQELDQTFHLKIAEISGNYMIYTVLSAAKRITDEIIQSAHDQLVSTVNNDDAIAKNHFEIYEALNNHDPERAEKAMRVHMDNTDKYMDKYFELHKSLEAI